MTEFGDNMLTPFEIVDAREAARASSEQQKTVETEIAKRSRALANAERAYRELLTRRIMELHVKDGVAWTACADIARGEEAVAKLREDRDIKRGLLESTQQQGYRYAADRRDLHTMIGWSERRDLRTEAEPDWSKQQTFGRRPPEGADPATGELRPAA